MSPDRIALVVRYDRRLWRRAMTGWWQSVVPPAPFVQRAIFWAIVWAGIGLLAGAVTLFGLTPWFVLAGLAGAAVLILVFVYLQRTRMARFWDVIGTHWDRAGDTLATFSAEGVVLVDRVSRRELDWPAIDAIRGVRGVTVLRSGIAMIAIPDATLPGGLNPRDFRARLEAWRSA